MSFNQRVLKLLMGSIKKMLHEPITPSLFINLDIKTTGAYSRSSVHSAINRWQNSNHKIYQKILDTCPCPQLIRDSGTAI